MKRQRLKFKLLALLLFALFALLAAYGGYSIYSYGNRWFASGRNPRVRAARANVIPGDILDRTGTVLATTDADGQRQYQQSREARMAAAHVVGDPQGQVANAVETFQTRYLYGFQASIPELVTTALKGEKRRGDDVTLTISGALCQRMLSAFQGHPLSKDHRGGAVVINYRTGEMLGLVSLPAFDPAETIPAMRDLEGSPYWNRVTQGLYPPGSTFKTIVAAAALRQSAQNTTFTCQGAAFIDAEHTLRDYGGAEHGEISLSRALRVSCNQYFAQLALRTLGDRALRSEAEGFGFNVNFLFRDLVVENSIYPTSGRTDYEVAMSGIGQSAIVATPMHMCLVAAGIANGGEIPEPRLLKAVTSPLGSQRLSFSAQIFRRAVSTQTAQALQRLLRDAVQHGTGSAADVSGMEICGKTGTAESMLNGAPINYGWFIGYAADDRYPFALAVLVEDIPDGEGGGSTAAPIAGDLFRYLKSHREELTD